MSIVRRSCTAVVAAAVAITASTDRRRSPQRAHCCGNRRRSGRGALFGAAVSDGHWGRIPITPIRGQPITTRRLSIGSLVRFGDRMDTMVATPGLCGTGGMCTMYGSAIDRARGRFVALPVWAVGWDPSL